MAADAIIDGIQPRPVIRHGGNRAYYAQNQDTVQLPEPSSFARAEDYCSVRFHELTHWTGHASRLNRATLQDAVAFGDTNYSKEELVAEMGAGFLCALSGIENKTIDQSASYLDNWLGVLKGEPSLLVQAASQAQRAVEYLAPSVKQEAPPARMIFHNREPRSGDSHLPSESKVNDPESPRKPISDSPGGHRARIEEVTRNASTKKPEKCPT